MALRRAYTGLSAMAIAMKLEHGIEHEPAWHCPQGIGDRRLRPGRPLPPSQPLIKRRIKAKGMPLRSAGYREKNRVQT